MAALPLQCVRRREDPRRPGHPDRDSARPFVSFSFCSHGSGAPHSPRGWSTSSTDGLSSIRTADAIRAWIERIAELPCLASLLHESSAFPSHRPVQLGILRGGLADDGEWRIDPAKPAVVVGTVDMIGSRIMFSGYGDGRSRRPMHAGLLGHDSIVMLDEAHLSPAMGALIHSINRDPEPPEIPDHDAFGDDHRHRKRISTLFGGRRRSRGSQATKSERRLKESAIGLQSSNPIAGNSGITFVPKFRVPHRNVRMKVGIREPRLRRRRSPAPGKRAR